MPGTLLIGFRTASGGYTVVSAANPLPVTGGGGGGSTSVTATAAAPTYIEGSTTNPLSVDLAGNLRVISELAAGAAVTIDQTTGGLTNGVVLKNSGGTEINLADPTTGTGSQVASSETAVTILAANTARKGATVFNDSSAILYLILSNTTPTSAAYTVKMAPGGFYEVPFGYNGIIKGVWASENGYAVVTELT